MRICTITAPGPNKTISLLITGNQQYSSSFIGIINEDATKNIWRSAIHVSIKLIDKSTRNTIQQLSDIVQKTRCQFFQLPVLEQSNPYLIGGMINQPLSPKGEPGLILTLGVYQV